MRAHRNELSEIDKVIRSESRRAIIDFVDKRDISRLSSLINTYTLEKEEELKKDVSTLRAFIYLVSTLMFRAQIVEGGNQRIKFNNQFYKSLDALIEEAERYRNRVYS